MMRDIRKFSWSILIALAMLVSGCATPLPKEKTFVVSGIKSTVPISLSVIDYRPYIVNKDKTEDFEGIARAAFGIPNNFSRAKFARNDPENKWGYVDQTFADLLAGMLLTSLKENGNTVRIDRYPPGATVTKVDAADGKAILVYMHQSKVDFGFGFSYVYDFRFNYIYGNNKFEHPVTGSIKSMSEIEEMAQKNQSNVPDTLTLIYKDILEKGLQRIEHYENSLARPE